MSYFKVLTVFRHHFWFGIFLSPGSVHDTVSDMNILPHRPCLQKICPAGESSCVCQALEVTGGENRVSADKSHQHGRSA